MILINILIIFGGKSSEYEVSLRSAASVINNIPRDKYNVYTLGITKDGKWLYYEGNTDLIEKDEWLSDGFTYDAFLSVNASDNSLNIFENSIIKKVHIDVIFPVLHGKNGEDGTIQGLLELSGIPYIGCGVLSSAACMDKAVTNTLCDSIGIRQANWRLVKKYDFNNNCIDLEEIIDALSLPLFVKPANAGSSVGISKANTKEEVINALTLAFMHDSKAVLESAIVGRELECSVMGNNCPIASSVGEIAPCNEFYDYDAKYIDENSKLYIPAALLKKQSDEIKANAIEVYKMLDCRGLARVDFFMDNDGLIYFNEINTIPGFTSISMYPKLFEQSGIPYPQLIEKLIEYAFEKE
ncbi:MAG TPA: D-alanine--D-alanine ligase family protein [Clostridia bacterium]|nr:D-alanine--D-alanine ligase family protein [Clostridia bacterium]